MGLEVNSIDSLSSFGLFDGTHKMWRREISSALLATPYVLYEDPCKAGNDGEFFLWPAALTLMNYVETHRTSFSHRNVLELGSSHGLGAMAASRAGASRVVATDRASSLWYLAQNVSANPDVLVEIRSHEWGEEEEELSRERWSSIIGSDLTFFLPSFSLLLASLLQLCDDRTEVLLFHDDDSIPGGWRMRRSFFEVEAVKHFKVSPLDLSFVKPSFLSPTIFAYRLLKKTGASTAGPSTSIDLEVLD
uniref:Uncharacterized protein n=1 Tax=Guillardia theta TaxID=55529 RepID=A0A7S4UJB9_GUITH|mmetsp:Transcript_5339/g.18868  ORF Transcript_5339/g.18868 Transcript_5339/m.18868 type:complete len:248 (+) Transcript_5339:27-770(+)